MISNLFKALVNPSEPIKASSPEPVRTFRTSSVDMMTGQGQAPIVKKWNQQQQDDIFIFADIVHAAAQKRKQAPQ